MKKEELIRQKIDKAIYDIDKAVKELRQLGRNSDADELENAENILEAFYYSKEYLFKGE